MRSGMQPGAAREAVLALRERVLSLYRRFLAGAPELSFVLLQESYEVLRGREMSLLGRARHVRPPFEPQIELNSFLLLLL